MLTPWFYPFPLQSPELTLSQKIKAKLQNPDLLELCHLVPKEVVQLGEAWEAKVASALCFSSEILGSYPLDPGQWEFAKQTRSLGKFPLSPSFPCSRKDKDSSLLMERGQEPGWEDASLVTVGEDSVALTRSISFFS